MRVGIRAHTHTCTHKMNNNKVYVQQQLQTTSRMKYRSRMIEAKDQQQFPAVHSAGMISISSVAAASLTVTTSLVTPSPLSPLSPVTLSPSPPFSLFSSSHIHSLTRVSGKQRTFHEQRRVVAAAITQCSSERNMTHRHIHPPPTIYTVILHHQCHVGIT